MDSSSSLHLDEHLARFLAAYDQGIGGGDGKAPTLDLPYIPSSDALSPPPGARPGDPLAEEGPHQGSLSDLLPDSRPTDAVLQPPPVFDPTPTPDTHRVGRFELRRQLGKGGCGIVFLAYDPRLKREVALKIPRPELLLSADARRRLIREAHAAAEFDHPNLVPVYETGEIGPVCFIATAFCPGQTLADWLDRQAFPVPVRQAARLVAQIADAVQHAHDRGVLHRDLKPNNVILQESKDDPATQGPPPGACLLRGDYFVPRVVDFGLAKLAEGGTAETATRQVLGTPKYMAPEQAQARREDIGPEADVYALGVILYELLAGRPPYEGATDVEILRQAIEGLLTPPRHLRTDIPRDLEAICLKAMARSPAARYRSAIDLADDLRRFLEGLPTLARPLKWTGRAARWLRRNDQAVALAVVSGVALFFLGIGLWNWNENRKLQGYFHNLDVVRMRADRQADYARHVRDAFLSWRAGDAKQMEVSLLYARSAADLETESREFAWGYLSQLGRVERQSVTCEPAAIALAVSPDGSWVVTGHADGTLAVRDRQTGAVLASEKAHPAAVSYVAFLGGSRLVTSGGEAAAKVWEIGPKGALAPAAVQPKLKYAVTALATSADGKVVYFGSNSGRCLAWDATGGRTVREWAATGGEPVVALAVSPDGTTVATAGATEPVRLTGVGNERTEDVVVRGAVEVLALAFNPTGSGEWLFATAGRTDGTVRLFDHQGRELRNFPGHTGAVLALDVSQDGTSVASGGDDDGVCVWDVATGSMRALLRGHFQPVKGARFSPDGKALYSVADDGQLKVWDLTADPEGKTIHGLRAGVVDVAIAPDGRGFTVALADGSAEVYPDRDSPPRHIPADRLRKPFVVVKYPESGPPVGVELVGRQAFVWELGPVPRVALRAKVREGSTVVAYSLSAGARRLALGDDRGRVSVWALTGATPVVEFDTNLAAPVRLLSLSDDGSRVAALTVQYNLGVWDLGGLNPAAPATPGQPNVVPVRGEETSLVRFLPGAFRVVTTGRGNAIKVWEVDPYAEKKEVVLLGHSQRVTELAVSPDGRTLASGSVDGEVKLWDLRTGQELVGLKRHTRSVTAAEFSENGRVLITGGTAVDRRGELAFWDAALE